MPQQQSQAGQVGFKTQAAMGSFDSPGAAAPSNGIFPPILSGSMVGQRDLLLPDPEVGGNRDQRSADLAAYAYEGDYELYARLNSLPTLLNAVLGGVASTDNGTYHTHVITPIDAGELPWLSIEEAIGQSFDTFQYVDGRVNTLSLEAEPDAYLMVNAGIVAIDGSAGHTRTDLTQAPGNAYVDQSPIYVGTEIDITYNGVSLCAKSLSIEINNNFETDDYCLGKNTVDTFTPKARSISMSVTIRPQDSALWKRAMYGSDAVNAALAGQAAQAPAQITLTSNNLIDGTNPFRMVIDVPVSVIAPFEVSPSGDDVIESDLEITALRPDPAVAPITFTIDNGLAAVA